MEGVKPSSGSQFILGVIAASMLIHVIGIKRDLPIAYDPYENTYVVSSVQNAADGNLRTVLFSGVGIGYYLPLTGLYMASNAALHGGNLGFDPSIQVRLSQDNTEFYILARMLSMLYALGTIPLVFNLGKRMFDRKSAYIATFLAAISPTALLYGQTAGVHAATMFYATLATLMCSRLFDNNSMYNRIVAAVTVGIGISTNYALLALLPVLMGVDIWNMALRHVDPRNLPRYLVISTLTALGTFSILNPLFFVDSRSVLEQMLEARILEPGHDGLSNVQTFMWYVQEFLPSDVGWGICIMAVLGCVFIVTKVRSKAIPLVGFAIVYLIGISLYTTYWPYRVLPLIPVIALLAGNATANIARGAVQKLSIFKNGKLLATSIAVALALQPINQILVGTLQRTSYSTRVDAAQWINQNIEANATILREPFIAPQIENRHKTIELPWNTRRKTIPEWKRDGVEYAVVNADTYAIYKQQESRYPQEVKYYQTLQRQSTLLHTVTPHLTRGGPTIEIYEL